jgi:small-conductance mechanosensitive channel
MNVATTDLERLIVAVTTPDGARDLITQLLVLGGALLAAWLVSRSILARMGRARSHWKFGESGFQVVVFPLLALALLFAAKLAVRRWLETPILDLANTLLVAFAVIRFAVYVLGHVLPHGGARRFSERTVAWVMWIGVALYVTGLLPEIREALDEVAVSVGKQRVSLLLVINGTVALAVTLAITMWVARLIERRVLAHERMEMSTRVVVAKLANAAALFIAILVVLPVIGIDMTALSVFGGALGVGLGFGLQKIASNYVSGYIILLDRSIRIGDQVTVDNRMGIVRAIASRYTVIRSADGTESIIPNETLVTQSVTNHSFTDRKAVVKVSLPVPFASDLDAVIEAMQAVGRAHPRVLPDPAPQALIIRVGDPGVEVELSAWIDDAQEGAGQVRSDLWKAILGALRGRGIEVPSPRREIRLEVTPATKEITGNTMA